MTKILVLVKMLLLALSLFGYREYLSDRKKLKMEFIPVVIFSGIGCIMFLAGILNILEIATVAILLVGALLAFNRLKNKIQPGKYITGGTISIVVLFAIFFLLTHHNKLLHYDNFSHWGMVVRNIVLTDAFPNFADVNIMFQSYPTGSAAFIYFFSEVTGMQTEWFFLCVQQLLIISSFCTVFAFCNKKDVVTNTFTFFTVLMMLISNNNITEALLVDTLLPALGIAGMAICIYYKEDIANAKPFLTPIVVFLIAVKNSGAFFSVAIIGYYLYRVIKHNGIKSISLKKDIPFAVSPAVVFLLWDKHVDMAFESGMTSKHAMSLEKYAEIFSLKIGIDIQNITSKFINEVFSFENTFIFVLLAVAVLLICKGCAKKDLLETSRIILIFYVVYQIGTYLMYLVSMPLTEALTLASYDRYHRTVLIFIVGLLVIMATEVFGKIDNKINVKNFLLAFTLIIVFFFTLKPDRTHLQKQEYTGTDRQVLDSIIEKYGLDTYGDKSYVLYWDSSGYRWFMCRYALNPTTFRLFDSEEFGDTIYEIGNYEYMIVVNHTEEIDEYLVKYFGTAEEDVYKIP